MFVKDRPMLQGISNAAAAPTKSYLLERRILARKPVIKSAKLAVGSLFNEGLYNCLVLDESKGGDGHGAEFTLPADQLPPDLPPLGLPAAADQKAAPAAVASGAAAGEEPNSQCPTRSPAAPGAGDSVNHELVELRREFQDFRQEVRWHDVLGGIGYIVGVAGIAFYFLGVRRKELRRP